MRRPRAFYKDSFYHLITRSNQDIFLNKRDFIRYLNNLEKFSEKYAIKIVAFALMPNHVHLLAQQVSETPISKFLQVTNTAYVNYFNLKYKRYGSLFQSHCKAIFVETDEYLVHLSRYIHLNASSANLVRKPEDSKWTSYKHYLGLEKLKFVDESVILDYFSSKNPIADYKEFIESRIDYQKEISLQKLMIE